MAVARPLYLQALTDYTAEEFRALIDANYPVAGVVTGLTPGPTESVSMAVAVSSGYAAVQAKGGMSKYLVRADATEVVPIEPAGTQPRIDLIVVQVNDSVFGGADDGAVITVVQGQAADVPVPPAMPDAAAIMLATVTVRAATATITASDISDARTYAQPQPEVFNVPAVAWNLAANTPAKAYMSGAYAVPTRPYPTRVRVECVDQVSITCANTANAYFNYTIVTTGDTIRAQWRMSSPVGMKDGTFSAYASYVQDRAANEPVTVRTMMTKGGDAGSATGSTGATWHVFRVTIEPLLR